MQHDVTMDNTREQKNGRIRGMFQVLKRDGGIVEFQMKKITDANIKDMYEQDLKDLKKELKGMNV